MSHLPPRRRVDADAKQQTYYGIQIVINGGVPYKQAWVVYPDDPLSLGGRGKAGLTEAHMSAETHQLVEAAPNRKDISMSKAPAAAYAPA